MDEEKREELTEEAREESFNVAPRAVNKFTLLMVVLLIIVVIIGGLIIGGFFSWGANEGAPGANKSVRLVKQKFDAV